MSFTTKILPTEGLYCVATLYPNGGFKHHFCDDVAEVHDTIRYLCKAGETVYLAQGSFKSDASRKQENVAFMRNFFFDIDCGPGKDYPSQKEAVAALKEFISNSDLPFPAIVSSGNGLYAHWPIEENIPAAQWKTIARILKATAAGFKFNTDPMRTADSASVLRPVGAIHLKDPKNPKTVSLLKDIEPIKFNDFVQALTKAAKKVKVDISQTKPPKPSKDINADFFAGIEDGPPAYAAVIAEKCSQIGYLRSQKGNVSEPFWYAGLGILAFCEEEDLKYEWSSGHPEYSASATDAKAQQYIDSGVGPTTCAHFGTINAQGCMGCPHNGRIKSPIVLGREAPEAIEEELPEGEESEVPKGFRRTEKGLYWEEEGRWTRFYDQDLYVDRLAFDESLGYQVAVVKHSLPLEGEMEFSFRSALIHDPKALMTALTDNHVHVVGVKEKKVMVAYVEGYLAQMARKRRMTTLLNQMGWKKRTSGEAMFVLGKKIFHQDGSVEDASLARNVPTAATGFRSQGDLNKWVNATALLGKPGMEPYAFALLCGLGAPLMKFTGFDGALVSLVGDSGIGKTLMLRWVQSLYGYHKDLIMLRDDTRNALMSRLGVYGNLPLAIDEITNIEGNELSDLVYRVTQGRDKARLTKNAEERKTLNGWNTIAIISSNSALIDKLSGAKHDASAEMNRVFEYVVPARDAFSGDVTSDVYNVLDTNYGYVGEQYLSWLVQNADSISAALSTVQKKLNADVQMKGEERFWSAVASCAIYGGIVARKLGLLKFEIAPVLAWCKETIIGMRDEKESLASGSLDILAQFLDENTNGRLIVKGSAQGRGMCTLIERHRGPLTQRHEQDKDKLYISRGFLKSWLSKKQGSYHKLRADLTDRGVLLSASRQKNLGAGTDYTGSTQPCWEIDLSAKALGFITHELSMRAEAYDMKGASSA